MAVGENIRAARKKANITQRELATIINKSYSAVQKYEIGIAMPPLDVVASIANALNVSPSYLIGYDDKIIFPEQYSTSEIEQLQQAAWGAYTDSVSSAGLDALKRTFLLLNDKGQRVAVERVEELTKIQDYIKK